MSPLATLLWITNLVLDTVGQLAFKAASIDATKQQEKQRWVALAGSIFLWVGISSFIGEFFLWLGFLSVVPLSQGVLVGCVNIIGIMIGARICFNEYITFPRVCALSFIALGVFCVGWG